MPFRQMANRGLSSKMHMPQFFTVLSFRSRGGQPHQPASTAAASVAKLAATAAGAAAQGHPSAGA